MKTQIVKIANIVAAVLVIVAIVLTFLPYWHYVGTEQVVNDEGKKVKVEVEKDASINGYIWMVDNHKELTKIFEKQAKAISGEALDTNDLLVTPLLQLILGVVALIFIIRNFDSLVAPFICCAFGVISITGYLDAGVGGSLLRMGNTWNSHMFPIILGAIIAVAAVISFAFNVPAFIKKLKGSY